MLRSQKTTTYLFYAYLLLLTWGILFKFGTEPIYFFLNARIVNWVPFLDLFTGSFSWLELAVNLVFFISLGFYLSLLFPKWSWRGILEFAFVLSLAYESLQFLLAIGIADITDIVLNVLGAALGVALYPFFQKRLGRKALILINCLSLIFIVLSLCFPLINRFRGFY